MGRKRTLGAEVGKGWEADVVIAHALQRLLSCDIGRNAEWRKRQRNGSSPDPQALCCILGLPGINVEYPLRIPRLLERVGQAGISRFGQSFQSSQPTKLCPRFLFDPNLALV